MLHYILSLVQQVRHMFDEIDYNLEGKNAERFATLYSHGEFAHLFNSILNKLLIYSISIPQLWSHNTCSSTVYMLQAQHH